MTSGANSDIEGAIRFVQQWLTEAAAGEHGGVDTGAPECSACPLCRASGLLRSADPAAVASVVGGVLDVAMTAAEGLRAVADSLLATDPERAEPSTTDSGSAADSVVDASAAAEGREAS